MEQPQTESPTREEKRTAASRPYGTPQVDLRHMLEGDVPHDVDRCCLRYQKLRDLTDDKKVYTIYLIKVAPDGKDPLIQAENLHYKKIGKSSSQPVRVKQDVWHQ